MQLVTSSHVLSTIGQVRNHLAEADRLRQLVAADTDADEKKSAELEAGIKLHEKEAARLKRSLPGAIFQGSIMETHSAKGNLGHWRKQSAVKLNGLYMCDFDHVENPYDTWRALWFKPDPSGAPTDQVEQLRQQAAFCNELGIVLAYITPSGHGLKVVAMADCERGNIADNQAWLSTQLGWQCDEACKDASRRSFLPQMTDILYIDKENLFNYDNKEFENKYGEIYRRGNSRRTRHAADGSAAADVHTGVSAPAPAGQDTGGNREEAKPEETGPATIETNDDGQFCFKHVPYSAIEAEYWRQNGGEPTVGERHTRMLKFFGRLRYICDNNPEIIVRVAEHRGLGDEELRNIAGSACALKLYSVPPKDFRAVLESVGIQTAVQRTSREIMEQPEIDYDYWWQRLQPLLVPGFEEAAAGVPDNVKMGAVLAAGAMFGTYLTRCSFEHYDGKMLRLSFIVYIVGEAASGKSFIIDLDRQIMACMKQSDKPGREWERQYKEDKARRSTSSKAQKQDAQDIKHPVIRYVPSTISNAKLYQRLTDAYDGGCDMHLHLYTLESELATALRVQQGSWAGKLDLELKSFQNEEAGVDYANEQSVNGLIQVNWNQVISGTMDAMQRKVKPVNILDGYATRLAVFLMPSADFAMLDRKQVRRSQAQREALKLWGYRLDGLHGEINAAKLVNAAYDWVSRKTDEARENNDLILDYFRKRVPIYMVRYGIVHAMLNDYEHFKREGKLNITEKSIKFAELIGDFILYMQIYLFGQQVEDAMKRVKESFVPRQVKTKTRELFNALPEEFSISMLQSAAGNSTKINAYGIIKRWKNSGYIQKSSSGKYKKLIKKL